MNKINKLKDGQKVKVHYTGRLADGTVFDSSLKLEPLEFIIGSGQVIKGFDDALRDMTIGEKKTVTILAEQAYGAIQEDLIQEVDKSMFSDDAPLKIGAEFYGENDRGKLITFVIMGVKEDTVVINANHFLAGEDLTFEIELIEILDS